MKTFDEWWEEFDGPKNGGYSNSGISSGLAEAIWEAAQAAMREDLAFAESPNFMDSTWNPE